MPPWAMVLFSPERLSLALHCRVVASLTRPSRLWTLRDLTIVIRASFLSLAFHVFNLRQSRSSVLSLALHSHLTAFAQQHRLSFTLHGCNLHNSIGAANPFPLTFSSWHHAPDLSLTLHGFIFARNQHLSLALHCHCSHSPLALHIFKSSTFTIRIKYPRCSHSLFTSLNFTTFELNRWPRQESHLSLALHVCASLKR